MTTVSVYITNTYAIYRSPDTDKSATGLVYPLHPMRYGVFTFEIDVCLGGVAWQAPCRGCPKVGGVVWVAAPTAARLHE